MSAQGKWRVDEGGFANSIGRVVLSNEGRFVGIMSRSDAEAIVAGMNAHAVVAVHNAQCEAEPVGWQPQTDDGAWLGKIEPTKERAQYLAQAHLSGGVIRPLYTAPPPPASAVAKVEDLRRAEAQAFRAYDSTHIPTSDTPRIAYLHGMKIFDEIIRVLKEAGL